MEVRMGNMVKGGQLKILCRIEGRVKSQQLLKIEVLSAKCTKATYETSGFVYADSFLLYKENVLRVVKHTLFSFQNSFDYLKHFSKS